MIRSLRKSKRSSNETPKHTITRVESGIGLNGSRHVDEALQSPKKVIRALYSYQPQGPGELRFERGDFFHVLGDVDQSDENSGWCEATNPMTHAHGMVPISYFEVFGRSRPAAADDSAPRDSRQSSQRNSNQTLYAVVLYEFKAEREDELDVHPGENLIICAHHEYEWFIAKPINRLGGPGLVPVSYVKIIDLSNPMASLDLNDDTSRVIDEFKIPTVEEWKNRTAKYQASTIPLGSISHLNPVSANTQYFQKDSHASVGSNRSSLSASNITITDVGVESYQLDHGRYQYLIVAKLSNGKVRHLYRYYQDFYDLQVKLLELFPFEAGKTENSKRIIPSIPGPLINVNDSISKLRREKLDYYLKNLMSLPNHISKCEEVLRLFEVLNNGFDREFEYNKKENRTLKPINRRSNYQQDRLSQYSGMRSSSGQMRTSPTSSDSVLNRSSSSSTNLMNNFKDNAGSGPGTTNSSTAHTSHSEGSKKAAKVKVKFYYEDDIFVLLLPLTLKLQDLKTKLSKRLDLENSPDVNAADKIHLYLKDDFDDIKEESSLPNDELDDDAKLKLQPLEINNDEKFQSTLYDKCKITILL